MTERLVRCSVLAFLAAIPASVAAQSRPNFVVLVADDLGVHELGAHGQARIRTPNLDRLAARSAVFDRAYSTAPVCAPSRCSILTGLHAGHCAVSENAEPNLPLASRDPTLAELLAPEGYTSAVVGKWALGGELEEGVPFHVESAPWRVGFDASFVVLDQALAQDHFPPWVWVAGRGQPGVQTRWPENDAGARMTYAPERFASAALELVRELPEPFVLLVSFTLPHRELVLPVDHPAADADPDTVYAAMVETLDAQVGAIESTLEERGVLGRTVIAFTSDNGPNAIDGHTLEAFDSGGPLRGRKRDLYEGGIRVPLFVGGPGIEARRIRGLASSSDLTPTLVELAGGRMPPVDGVSLARALRGDAPPVDRALYVACREHGGGAFAPSRDGVVETRWKWLRDAAGREQLFDLERDPRETTDLAEAHPDRVRALRAIADEALAPRPVSRPQLALVGMEHEASAGVTLLELEAEDLAENEWPSRIDVPDLVATSVQVEAHDRGALFDRSRPSYVVVPAHPALAVGREDFTVEATFRMAALAEGPERGSRQWLVLAKPMGTHDDLAAIGVLVQAGDLCTRRDCTGRELALVLGDPELGPDESGTLVFDTQLGDLDEHRLVVRVLRSRGRVEVELDGQVERVPMQFRRGVAVEAPWIVGAHVDARGRFGSGFAGVLRSLRVSAGAPTSPSRIEVQRVVDRDAAVFELETGDRSAHWCRLEVVEARGAHASLARTLALGGESSQLEVTLEPDVHEALVVVQAREGRTGRDAGRLALRLIRPGRARPEAPWPWLALALVVAVGTAAFGLRETSRR